DDLREVVSTADEPWAALASELGGRGVPSLDEALGDLRLRPVHHAVRQLIVATTPKDVAARRAELAGLVGLPPPGEKPAATHRPAGASTAIRRGRQIEMDPAARAVLRLRPLDVSRFDDLRVGAALRTIGLDDGAVDRVRVGLELPTPRTIGDPVALATA